MAETEAKKSMDGGKSVEGEAVSAVDAMGALGGDGTVGEGRSAVDVQIFREDVVQNVTRPSLVGVVTKVGGDSDSEYSSDSEDEEEEEILEGEARVCWMNTDEHIEKVGDLRVIDRALQPGDVVAKASALLGQTGTVVNVEMLVDLELPTGEIMRDVNSRSLRRVRAIAPEDYVVYDMWIGLVEEVHDNLTVLFGDGAMCKVSRADPDRLLPLNQTGIEDLDCPYFQGQKICGPASTFKRAKWLKGSWNASRTEGTVVELEAGTVVVKWISARDACYGNLQPPAIPEEEVYASRVLPIIHFSHTNWQLGDRSLFSPPTSNAVLRDSAQVDSVPSDHNAESAAGHSNLPICSVSMDLDSYGAVDSGKTGGKSSVLQRRESKMHRRQAKREKLKNEEEPKDFQQAVLIVNTRTTVDVLWQDGGISEAIDSCSVIPVDHLGDHEFWPEQYVMERGADGEGLDGDVPKLVGVVKVVDAKQRTASVRWLKSLNPSEGAQKFESEEIVSVYELIEHPDFSYCLGDLVTSTGLIPKPNASDKTRAENENSKLTASSRVEDTLEAETEDIVRADAGPKQREKSEQPITSKLESPSSDLSWVGVIIGLQDGDIEVAWANGMVSKVGPLAIRVVDKDIEDYSSAYSDDLDDAETLNDVFSWEPVVSDNDNNGGIHNESEDAIKKCDDEKQFSGALKTTNALSDEDSLPDIRHKKGTIKNFDSVKDHSDHHFISETSQPTNNRRWIKKIQQEWSILGKNLPDSIYVRVFEDRMDLLRAVIVGAEQTPYHDGLFVFDIYLPPEYPSVPPVAYYHSGGLRLNPNLYADGKVCLSLLNTWTGSNSEIWHPLKSSILQILVSLQGLVLNAKPYFNEAGYEKQVGTGEGEKNSLSYNENSFLLTCKSMMYLIRRPPMHLEGLVREHFQNRGHHILLASRAYLAGAEVGSLTESDFSGLEDRTFDDQSSVGFKLMLNKLFPKLASTFEVVGAESMKPVHEPSEKQAAQEC